MLWSRFASIYLPLIKVFFSPPCPNSGQFDCGQLLNGGHTTSSETDWKEFNRAKDQFCLKALGQHTGTSFAETCISAGLVRDDLGRPFFGRMNAFVSYTWRGEGITFANLVRALDRLKDSESLFFFIDVFVCAQHRGVRVVSKTCANETDVHMFASVISSCERFALYATPLTKPKALTRMWCLFEVMSAMREGLLIDIALSPADEENLASLLDEDFDAVVTAFTSIRAAEAEATVQSDRDLILRWIAEALGENGCERIDQDVADRLRLWLVETAKRMVQSAVEEDDATAELLLNCGLLLEHLANYEESESMFRRAVTIKEKALGVDHFKTCGALNHLASALMEKNDFAAAKVLYRRIVAIRERHYGAEDVETAHALNNLANLLDDLADYEAAEATYRKVVSIYGRVLGADHRDTAMAMDGLACVLSNVENFDESENYYNRALAIRTKVLGPEHPETARSMNNLAGLLIDRSKPAKAEVLYRKVYAIRLKVLGAEHPETADCLCNLGGLLANRGRFDEAEESYRTAIAIYEKLRGPAHKDTAEAIDSLATLLEEKGDYVEAERLYRQALGSMEKVLGPEHPSTASIMANLACLLDDHITNGSEEAEVLLRRALTVTEKAKGASHTDTAIAMSNLASTISSKADCLAEAEELCNRALAIYDPSHEQTHTYRADALCNLAGIMDTKGELGRAESLYREAIIIYEHDDVENADNRRKIKDTADNLVSVLQMKGDIKGVVEMRRKVKEFEDVAVVSDSDEEGESSSESEGSV